MNRYQQRFNTLKQSGQKAFIPFTLLGWPNKQASLEIIKTMIESGVSALELGLAFSEPAADGPIIQQAAYETIATGFGFNEAMELIREIRKLDSEIPIGLMVYYNLVLAQGIEPFYKTAQEAGVDGILIADLPPESADEVTPIARQYGIAPLFIISPLSSEARLESVLEHAGGFLYAVSRLGITGTEARYDANLPQLIERTLSKTHLPICIGFGISTPEQAQQMLKLGADGVITGSKVIQLVQNNPSTPIQQVLTPYFKSMVQAVQTQAANP